MRKQSLKQAMHMARTGKSKSLAYASGVLDGKPVGGWGETRQAISQMIDELPARQLRSYTANEWLDAMYTVDCTDRYRMKDDGDC